VRAETDPWPSTTVTFQPAAAADKRLFDLPAFVLERLFGAGGIAAAIALGAWSSALSLIRRGATTFGFSIDDGARRRLPRIVLAALAMGVLLWLVAHFAFAAASNLHSAAQAFVLLVLIAGGIAVYALALGAFGVTGWRQTLNAIRPSPPDDLRA